MKIIRRASKLIESLSETNKLVVCHVNHLLLIFLNQLQVEFVADTLRLNLLELGKSGSHLISVSGRLEYKCPAGESLDPITFTTRESHLVSFFFFVIFF